MQLEGYSLLCKATALVSVSVAQWRNNRRPCHMAARWNSTAPSRIYIYHMCAADAGYTTSPHTDLKSIMASIKVRSPGGFFNNHQPLPDTIRKKQLLQTWTIVYICIDVTTVFDSKELISAHFIGKFCCFLTLNHLHTGKRKILRLQIWTLVYFPGSDEWYLIPKPSLATISIYA